MLIRFAVSNFLSFKDTVEFSMLASKITRHSDHISIIAGKRVLKGGFIFGANASGKTNFVKAMAFARDIVTDGLSSVNCEKKHFRIESSYVNKPGVFQFDIFAGGQFYSYGFAISYAKHSIEEEWLYQIDEIEACVFLRSKKANGEVEFKSDFQLQKNSQNEKFNVYSDDIKNPKMDQTLFLSDVALRSPNSDFYKPFKDVTDWFLNLNVIFAESSYASIVRLMEDEKAREQFAGLLSYFDTGITALSHEAKDIDYAMEEIPKEKRESLLTTFKRDLAEEQGKRIHKKNSLLEITMSDGDLSAFEIVSNHGNDEDLFEYEDESDGTQRLFHLIPIFQHAIRGSIIIIDELDRSLHTKLTLEFIRYFYQVAKNCDAQIIATTHDSNVLDLDFLRQDEIWFMERKNDHSSEMYSLNKFQIRFDKKIEKDYLIGRYGAIPFFKQLNRLEEDGDCDE